MTYLENYAFTSRLYILEAMLTDHQKIMLGHIFNMMLCIQNSLLANNVEFDIRTMDYDGLINISSDRFKKTLKKLPRREIVGVLCWLKKVYAFDHVIDAHYNGIPASFCNKTLTLTVTQSPITGTFIIDTTRNGFLLYTSYSDGVGEHSLLSDDLLFKRTTFNRFIPKLNEYYCMEKSVLEMVLY
jgi:hypothetical protein